MDYANVTIDSASTGSYMTTLSSSSWSHTVGSFPNRYLIVGVCARVADAQSANLPLTAVTYNGVALTKLSATTRSGGGGNTISVEMWYLINPSLGSHSIALTFTGTISASTACAVSYYNVRPVAPEASTTFSQNAGGGGVTISTSVTTISPNALVVDVVGEDSGATWSAVAPAVQDASNDSVGSTRFSTASMCHRTTTTPGSYSIAQGTAFGNTQAQIIASLPFTPPPGGAGMLLI